MRKSSILVLFLLNLTFINSALSQKNNAAPLNAFANHIFDGDGYQPLTTLKWKFKTEGKIFSSPITKSGIVYIG
ncbi:MAG: pyrrolo-quinoline quinone, partial [Flavobacterium sp.]